MAITFVGSETSRNETSHAVPTGTTTDDVVFVLGGSDSSEPNLPTGYTLITFQNDGLRMKASYKVMGATPDTTVDGLDSDSVGCTIIATFRGVDTTNVLDAAATYTTGTGTTPNPPSITTVTDGACVIACAGLDDNLVADDVVGPLGYNAIEAYESSSSGCTIACEYDIIASAGSEDPASFNFVGAASDSEIAITVALRPYVNTGQNNAFFIIAK